MGWNIAAAYHSMAGVADKGGFRNPGDWFCDGTLSTGISATSNGVARWRSHMVQLRDDGESYSHSDEGNWAGINHIRLLRAQYEGRKQWKKTHTRMT